MCLNFEGEKEGRSYKFQYQYTGFFFITERVIAGHGEYPF